MNSAVRVQEILCIGLTGGIGCGKTTVAHLFQARGAFIIDTDEISHRLTQAGGEAIVQIREMFGDDFVAADGAMDRVRMRELIFSDEVAKLQLERVLHPLILTDVQQQLQQAKRAPYVLIVVPLLLENASFLTLVRRVLVVDCTEQNQVERVMQRSSLGEAQVRAIMQRQVTRQQRLSRADDLIYNDGEVSDLVAQVETLHQHYFSLGRQNAN
ncbi:MAG: dephospho-CoA kinase [Gallionella sp.]